MAVSVFDLVNRQDPELLTRISSRSDIANGPGDLFPRKKLRGSGNEG